MKNGGLVTWDEFERVVPELVATAVSEQQVRPASTAGLTVSTLTVYEVGNGTVAGLFDEDDPMAPLSTVHGVAAVGDRVKIGHTPGGGAFIIGNGNAASVPDDPGT